MKIPLKEEWQFMAQEDYAHYLFVEQTWEKYTTYPRRWGFIPGEYFGAEYVNGACNLFALKKPYDATNRKHFALLFTHPERWNNIHHLTEEYSRRMFALARSMQSVDAKRATNRELLRWVQRFHAVNTMLHDFRGPMWLLETPHNLVSDYLLKYLEELAEERHVKTKPTIAFQILTTPRKQNMYLIEKAALARIGLVRNAAARQRRFLAHVKKYEWLEYGLQGGTIPQQQFQKALRAMGRRGYRRVLTEMLAERTQVLQNQKLLLKEYGIGRTHAKIFRILQDSLYTRLYSKLAQFFAYYCMESILREIGRRGGLSLEQVRYLRLADFSAVLLKGKDLRTAATHRRVHSIHISQKGRTVFYLGAKAKQVQKMLKLMQATAQQLETTTLQGQAAYPGKARGRVKIINTMQEMVKIHVGNILVSRMTNPDIVQAMKVAAAIVTDLGGITSHAAIVARELRRPCVIGTKFATQVLHDGDTVEVDANKGIVRKI